MLARQLNRVSEADRRSRDFTLNELRRALREVIACFPVYRTYLRPGEPVAPGTAATSSRRSPAPGRRNPTIDASVFAFLQQAPAAGAPRGGRRGRPRPARGVRRPVPADDRAGPGQGAGGHGVLPAPEARVAQRGRRRPRPVRQLAVGLPRAERPAAGPLAGEPGDDRHARHQARGGHPHPHRRDLRAGRRVADPTGPLEAVERPQEGQARRRGGRRRPRRPRGIPPLPDPRRRLALRRAGRRDPGRLRRADPAVHAQGGPRGQGQHELDRHRPVLRRRARAGSSRRSSRGPTPARS